MDQGQSMDKGVCARSLLSACFSQEKKHADGRRGRAFSRSASSLCVASGARGCGLSLAACAFVLSRPPNVSQ
eukprot:13559722-Heterocapsa_arctica.AAC.1